MLDFSYHTYVSCNSYLDRNGNLVIEIQDENIFEKKMSYEDIIQPIQPDDDSDDLSYFTYLSFSDFILDLF